MVKVVLKVDGGVEESRDDGLRLLAALLGAGRRQQLAALGAVGVVVAADDLGRARQQLSHDAVDVLDGVGAALRLDVVAGAGPSSASGTTDSRNSNIDVLVGDELVERHGQITNTRSRVPDALVEARCVLQVSVDLGLVLSLAAEVVEEAGRLRLLAFLPERVDQLPDRLRGAATGEVVQTLALLPNRLALSLDFVVVRYEAVKIREVIR